MSEGNKGAFCLVRADLDENGIKRNIYPADPAGYTERADVVAYATKLNQRSPDDIYYYVPEGTFSEVVANFHRPK